MNNYVIPLFPLNVVIFPEGLLPLKIFEARYLDMVRNCLRTQTSFGVVAVHQSQNGLPFAAVGTRFKILDADVPSPGLMAIQCAGQQRFRVKSAHQASDGLWMGEVADIEQDQSVSIPDDLKLTASYLERLIASLRQADQQNGLPFLEPFKLDDCAWVANRWCELLEIPIAQKQRMLELDSPLVRLELVQDILSAQLSRQS